MVKYDTAVYVGTEKSNMRMVKYRHRKSDESKGAGSERPSKSKPLSNFEKKTSTYPLMKLPTQQQARHSRTKSEPRFSREGPVPEVGGGPGFS